MAPVLLVPLLGLAACGAGSSGEAGAVSPVAAFALGGDSPEAERYQLTPALGTAPEPPAAPPEPDLGGQPGAQPMPSLPVTGWTSLESTVAWVNDGEHLGVVTWGSSSCPTGPQDVQVLADQEIAITLGPTSSDQDVCTADLSPYVTVIELPAGVTPTAPLTAHVDGYDTTVPAVGG